MLGRQLIRHAPELEGVWVVEGLRVEDDDPVPARRYGNGGFGDHGPPRDRGAEVRPARRRGLVASVVAQGECVVVVCWGGVVDRAGGGVVTVSRGEEAGDVLCLSTHHLVSYVGL